MSDSSLDEKAINGGSCEGEVEQRKGSIAEGELEVLGYKQELHRERSLSEPF